MNNCLSVRFPRSDNAIQRLAIEIDLLSTLRSWLSVPIPVPEFYSLRSGAVGQVFMGYRRLPGEPLWPVSLTAITDERAVHRLATAVMAVLRAVHGVPIQRLLRYPLPLACGLATQSWQRGWLHWIERLTVTLTPHLDALTQQTLRSQPETFVDLLPAAGDPTTLIHGDLASGTILIDPVTYQLTGITGLGAAGRGDPAYDVATLLAYGEPFVAAGLAMYPEIEPALNRARCYRQLVPLRDAAAAIVRGDRAGFEHHIARWMRCATRT